MYFLDANIILRHLIRDNPEKAEACFQLFKKADAGEVTLTTTEAVITEVVYVLASKKHYALSREEIRTFLHPILSLKGL